MLPPVLVIVLGNLLVLLPIVIGWTRQESADGGWHPKEEIGMPAVVAAAEELTGGVTSVLCFLCAPVAGGRRGRAIWLAVAAGFFCLIAAEAVAEVERLDGPPAFPGGAAGVALSAACGVVIFLLIYYFLFVMPRYGMALVFFALGLAMSAIDFFLGRLVGHGPHATFAEDMCETVGAALMLISITIVLIHHVVARGTEAG